MVRLAAFVIAAPLLAGCTGPQPTPTNPPTAPSLAAPPELVTLSETQPVTALAVLDQKLYAGTPDGLIEYDLRTKKHVRFGRGSGLPGSEVRAVACHPTSGTWVATTSGLACYRQGSWSAVKKGAGRADPFTALLANADGVWGGSAHGLSRLSGSQWSSFLPGARITHLMADLTGEGVWVGTDGEGIYHFENGAFASHSPARGQMIRRVSSLALSPEGGLFATGRDQQGVHRLAFFDGKEWTTYTPDVGGAVRWVQRVGQEMLLALGQSVYWVRRQDPTLPPEKARRGPVRLDAKASPTAAPHYPVVQLYTELLEWWLPTPTVMLGHENRVFFGTRTAGVGVFDGQALVWYRTRDLVGEEKRLKMACTSAGTCYLAGSGRAHVLEKGSAKALKLDGDPAARALAFVSDRAGGILALHSAADGQTIVVSRLEGDRFNRAFESKIVIPQGMVEVLFVRPDPQGRLWVGLEYSEKDGTASPWGVAVLTPNEPPLYHRSTLIPTEDRAKGSLALPDEVYDVLFNGEEQWLSSTTGVCRVRGSNIDLFTENEGLESEIVYVVTRSGTGQILAGSHGGVGRFDGKWWRFDQRGPLQTATHALLPRGEVVWAGTAAGLVEWKPGGAQRVIDRRMGLASDMVLDLYLENDRRLWVLTDNGLSIVPL